MPTLITILAFISIAVTICAQNAQIVIEKDVYKIDEQIKIKFEIDAKVDSVDEPEFKGLQIISGPNKSTSVSIKNGASEHSATWTYIFRPERSGKVTIESFTFHVSGRKVQSEPKPITILNTELTEKDLEELRFQTFVEVAIKPEGTYRFIVNEEFGYIEVYGDRGWQFHRRLTSEEFTLIKRLK